jgi:hypothetical protein
MDENSLLAEEFERHRAAVWRDRTDRRARRRPPRDSSPVEPAGACEATLWTNTPI